MKHLKLMLWGVLLITLINLAAGGFAYIFNTNVVEAKVSVLVCIVVLLVLSKKGNKE